MRLSSFLFATGCCLLSMQFEGQCQNNAAQTARATNLLNQMGSQSFSAASTQQMMLMPPDRTDRVVGNAYWDEHWGKSSLLLFDNPKLNEGFLTRYDIMRDEFEFNLNGQIKVAKGKLVKNVVWIDSLTLTPRYLVNAKEYTLDGVPLAGFLEVLVDGEQALMKRIMLEILRPNYNVAMSTGSTNSKITKDEQFYFSDKGKLTEIKSRKSLESVFGKESEQMATFIKAKKLKSNRQHDLVQIFTHLATLRVPGNK